MATPAKETDKTDRIEGVSPPSERVRISQKAFDWFFGYDYFIAHRSVDGKPYATALYDALTEKGNELDCFLDVKHYGVGGSLPWMQSRALKKTSRLIVVVTPHAHDPDAKYLQDEIRQFRRHHPNGTIVSVGTDGTDSTLRRRGRFAESEILPLIPNLDREDISIVEDQPDLLAGKVSPFMVAKLLNDFSEQRAAARRLKWIKGVAIVMSLLFLAAVGFGIYAASQRSSAQASAREANRRLAEVSWQLAQQARGVPFAVSELSSIKATHNLFQAARASEAGGQDPAIRNAIIAAKSSSRNLLATMLNGGSVNGVIHSPDGQRILSWSEDGTARLWKAASGAPAGQPMKHEGFLSGAVFSWDGQRILTWGDRTARLWETASGAPMGQPMKHVGVFGAMFSWDGQHILSWGNDGTARLWEAASGAPVRQPMKHEGRVWKAVFSWDGQRILSWSEDGTARLWEAASGAPVGQPMKHEGAGSVLGAVFSWDGKRILTWGDGTARLWETASGAPLGQSMKHEGVGSVLGAVFSWDGQRILTWTYNGVARLWNAANGAPVGQPMKHEGRVWRAMFNWTAHAF